MNLEIDRFTRSFITKILNTRAINPREILDARKNTRFSEFFLAQKTLGKILSSPCTKNARIINIFCTNWQKYAQFLIYFSKILAWFYSLLKYVLAEVFTRVI